MRYRCANPTPLTYRAVLSRAAFFLPHFRPSLAQVGNQAGYIGAKTVRLFLIVKGDRELAIQAARLHGVAAVWAGYSLDMCRDYTVLYADEVDHLRAVCWYMADRESVPPYLMGSLLYYSLVAAE